MKLAFAPIPELISGLPLANSWRMGIHVGKLANKESLAEKWFTIFGKSKWVFYTCVCWKDLLKKLETDFSKYGNHQVLHTECFRNMRQNSARKFMEPKQKTRLPWPNVDFWFVFETRKCKVALENRLLPMVNLMNTYVAINQRWWIKVQFSLCDLICTNTVHFWS